MRQWIFTCVQCGKEAIEPVKEGQNGFSGEIPRKAICIPCSRLMMEKFYLERSFSTNLIGDLFVSNRKDMNRKKKRKT